MIELLMNAIDRFNVEPVVKNIIEKEKFLNKTDIIFYNIKNYDILQFAFLVKEKKFTYIPFTSNYKQDELLYNVYITINDDKKRTKLIEAYITLRDNENDFDHNFEFFCTLLKKEIIKSEKRNLNALEKSIKLFDENPTYKLQNKISELVFKYHLIDSEMDPKYLFLDSNYHYNEYASKLIKKSIETTIDQKDIDITNKNMLFNFFNIDYSKHYNEIYQEFYSIMFDSVYFKPYKSFISYLKQLLNDNQVYFNKFINILIGKYRSFGYSKFYYDEDGNEMSNIFVDSSLENYALIKSEIADIIISRGCPIIDVDNFLNHTMSPLKNINQETMITFLKNSVFSISMDSINDLENSQDEFLKAIIYETKTEIPLSNALVAKFSVEDFEYLLNQNRIYRTDRFNIDSYIKFEMVNYVHSSKTIPDKSLNAIKEKINLLNNNNIEYVNNRLISKNFF